MKLTNSDLEKKYEELTSFISCECTLATELVGGIPADEKGLHSFAEHHLKIADLMEREAAVRRMLKEEIGKRDIAPEGGELGEQLTYGVNVIRRTEHGPYLGDWMVKACIKAAASRLNIFQEVKGSKGNFAEAGRVNAVGLSLNGSPNLIYLRDGSGEEPAKTYFQEFSGRVNSPRGSVSIIHHSECVAPGSRFAFEFRFLGRKLKEEDVAAVVSLMRIVGLGSAKALERGKFTVDECEIELS